MNNYAGPTMALKAPEIPTTFSMQAFHYSKEVPGGAIAVEPDGKRFTDEKYKNRHGKIPTHRTWKKMRRPAQCSLFLITRT